MTSLANVSSEEVVAYEPLVYSSARRYVNLADVEEADLLQEGRIAVAEDLAKGYTPNETTVGRAMSDWVRKCRRRGLTGFPDESEDDG